MKKLLLVLFALSLNVNAATFLQKQKVVALANGWSSKHLYITTDNASVQEGCSETDVRYILDSNHEQFDLLSSLLLSAFHSEADVRLYIVGCGPSNLMNIQSVKIEKS